MKRRERDFVALFNTLWYRDFPIGPGHEELGKRAVWTTHIASIFKQSADLMGLFTCYESRGRTDAVIQTATRAVWARIEWESLQPRSEKVNEFDKLAKAENDGGCSIFIGYSRTDLHQENVQKIESICKAINKPLIVFLVTFAYHHKRRRFDVLQTYRFEGGKLKKLRQQLALPWHVKGTKWAASVESAANADGADS
jgi:hypothetical protein